MGLNPRSIQKPPNTSGNIVTARPSPTPTIIWATIPDFENLPQGANFTHDIQQYAGGSGSASATFELVYIAGDSASAVGLTVTAGIISTSANTIGEGTYRARALHDGIEYPSHPFNLSVVASATDIVPPPPPLFLNWSATVSGIALTFLIPTDPKVSDSSADGMQNVVIEQRSASAAYAPVYTASVSAGISPQAQDVIIGVQSGSAVQASSSMTLYAKSSAGLTPNMDDIVFRYWTVNGDFDITAKIPAFSAPGSAKWVATLMVRETLVSGSKLYCHGRIASQNQPDGESRFSEVKYRSVTDGGINFSNPQNALSGDYYFRVSGRGSTRTASLWAPGDNQWTQNDQQTIVMNSTTFVGAAANAGATDDEFAAVFSDINVTRFEPVTIMLTGLQPGTQYSYRGIAKDLAGNVSEYGPEITLTTDVSVSAPASSQWDMLLASAPPDLTGLDVFTITTRASLDNYIDTQVAFSDHPAGLIYRITAASANQSFAMDFSSASANTSAAFYPFNVGGFHHVCVRGVKTKFIVQAGADVGEMNTSGEINYHPRLPQGNMFRIDNWGDIWFEGCDINGECWSDTASTSCAFNTDFIVVRSNNIVADVASSETKFYTFCNGRMIGNEGQDALHADYLHTQANDVDNRHLAYITYENVLGESGQEGGVYQSQGGNTYRQARHRRTAWLVTNRFQITATGRGAAIFVGSRFASAPLFIDTYAGRDDASSSLLARINIAEYAGNSRVDYTAPNAPNTSGFVVDSGLTYITNLSASAPTFGVSADSIGYGYQSPFGPLL